MVLDSAYCCFIGNDGKGCPNSATWRAYWEGAPVDSFTDGCNEHIGQLLPNARIMLEPLGGDGT